MLSPFHLAVPVDNLDAAVHFYGHVLGCQRGRCDTHWVDWNFFGHQLVTHLVTEMPSLPKHNQVDNHAVPVPHFGVVLNWSDWQALSSKLRASNMAFII